MSVTEITTPRAQQRHYGDVRDRLRNPPNAVVDRGINLNIQWPGPTVVPHWPPLYEDHLPVFEAVEQDFPRYPLPREIKKIVARAYAVSVIDMVSARRTSNVVRPRHVAIYLIRKMTNKSLPEIGRHFGARDHSTVMAAIRRIEWLRETDGELDNTITEIETEIAARYPV